MHLLNERSSEGCCQTVPCAGAWIVSFSKAEAEFRIEPLGTGHDRAGFSCGVSALDNYLQRQARQDMERRLAAVYVLTSDGKTVAGFYTLSAHSIFAGFS